LLGPAASRKATQVSEDQLARDLHDNHEIVQPVFSSAAQSANPPLAESRPHALSNGSAHAFHAIPPLAALNATQECDSKGESEKTDRQINHVVS
jgi:hypothetical protein